jgi:NAD(P)-dependent dehydrogenase (short-subunit alcohol dehydrogenase family)
MARIFITGSSDGLGLLTAKALLEKGHELILHARNEERKRETEKKVAGARVLSADLGDIPQAFRLATEVNALGRFDAVIHNAGVYQVPADQLLKVNVLAPYILTSMLIKPRRLIYLSSDMHTGASSGLDHLTSSRITYSDSKLYVLMLSMAAARLWPDVYANAVDPGWVPTKMGGSGAPDSLKQGYQTQLWLAESDDINAKLTGKYFYHKKEQQCKAEAKDSSLQEQLLDICEKLTGVSFPA